MGCRGEFVVWRAQSNRVSCLCVCVCDWMSIAFFSECFVHSRHAVFFVHASLFWFCRAGASARFKVRNSLFVTVGSANSCFFVCIASMGRFVAAAAADASASFDKHHREGRCRGNADAGQIPCYGESGSSCVARVVCLFCLSMRLRREQIETLAKRFDRECSGDLACLVVGAGKCFCCVDCKKFRQQRLFHKIRRLTSATQVSLQVPLRGVGMWC